MKANKVWRVDWCGVKVYSQLNTDLRTSKAKANVKSKQCVEQRPPGRCDIKVCSQHENVKAKATSLYKWILENFDLLFVWSGDKDQFRF